MINMLLKDLKIYLSDKKALAILVAMPLILIIILSFALQGSFSSDGLSQPIKIGIVKKYNMENERIKFITFLENNEFIDSNSKQMITDNIDGLNIDKILFENFLNNEEIKKIFDYTIMSEEDAYEALENKEIATVVDLPKDFVYSVFLNLFTPMRNNVEIKINGHPEYSYSTSIANEIFTSFTDTLSLSSIDKGVMLSVASQYDLLNEYYKNIELLVEDIEGEENNLDINQISITGIKSISSFSYYTLAMMAMFVLFSAGIVARSLLIEKHNITYDRMIATGVNHSMVLVSKFFVIVTLCLMQIGIIIFFSTLVFNVEWPNLAVIVLISLLLAISTAGLGTLIGAITLKVNDYKLASAFESVIIQIMALFGGSYIPLQVLPGYMQNIGKWTINGLALDAYLKIFQGGDLSNITFQLIRLIFIAITGLIAGLFIINYKGGKKNVKFTQS
ncbi:MAG: ABC transporter permease [Eubacteriaceae bacterium]